MYSQFIVSIHAKTHVFKSLKSMCIMYVVNKSGIILRIIYLQAYKMLQNEFRIFISSFTI